MKSQTELLTHMIQECSKWVGYSPNRDIRTVVDRVKQEGYAFLTIALPTLDDALLAGLSKGTLPVLPGWGRKSGTALPEFLWGFWQRIFRHDGTLLPDPCVNSIRAIRQISRTFKKVFEVCDAERVDESLDGFIRTDRELSQLTIPRGIDAMREITQQAFGKLVGDTITNISSDMFKHGPGAVAEKLGTNSRWNFDSISERIALHIGVETFRASYFDLLIRPPDYSEEPGRLVAVPKTATKPRLISIEPSYNQFIQQGYHTLLKDGLSKFRICSYVDQTPNQELARRGSLDGSLCTVDLSEASDRVHFGLVRYLFSFNRQFVDMLEATRSKEVSLPDGRTLILNKFASMGSALTFPVETMVFTVAVLYTACQVEGEFSRAFIKKTLMREDIRIYGDDIIVPTPWYPTLIRVLKEMGLKVNDSKSFSEGRFRESCGGDYWSGYDVTPIYRRRRNPRSKHHVDEIVSYTSFRNQWAAKYGYGPVVSYIDGYLRNIVPIPYVGNSEYTDGLAFFGPEDPLNLEECRWNTKLQRLEVRTLVPLYGRRKDVAPWYAQLFKSLVTPFQEDRDHLIYDGRPTSAKLIRRWVAVR